MAQAYRPSEDPELVATKRNSKAPQSPQASFPSDLEREDHTKASGGDVPPPIPEKRPTVVPLHRDGQDLTTNGQASPNERDETAKTGVISPKATGGSKSVNEKAQAMADAHRERVSSEAMVYLEAETRKLEARAQGLQAKAEKQRLHDEAKALERKKKEDMRADQMVADAQIEADKVLAKANEKAVAWKGRSQEEAERAIADAKSRAERWKAEEEEKKKREIAELRDKIEGMIAVGELPEEPHRSKLNRLKGSFVCI
eukprot:TRINITY_DN7_c0_g1_i3.p1 TRINITY_DN7_c0_g1~~TRINITY_DN7_c0_g1_i3.p1  ORF type:complete len:272 (+),score=60.37 TRINITY_DN7_c0_g1_i3:48-818(+)